MISDLERQFIEGAGRALTERCRHCRQDLRAAECVRPYADGVTLHEPVVAFRDHELAGSRLLGMLEQANGSNLRKIIETAYSAEEAGPGSVYIRTLSTGIPPEFVAEFASAIALEWLGAGVSWFDTHERFAVAHDHCARCGCARFHRTVTPKGCEKCGCQYPTFSRPFAVPQLRTEATP